MVILLPTLVLDMGMDFYSWYEGVFNECSLLVNSSNTSRATISSKAVGTLLFSGKFSSLAVVVRLKQPHDFVFSGAWPGSFKAFVYRQQHYHSIMYELYADQLDSKLVHEHKNLCSFLEGHSLSDRSNTNRVIGSRLDQMLKVVLPVNVNSYGQLSDKSKLGVFSIINGVFKWQRNFVLVQGDDTLEAIEASGIKVEVVQEKEFMLGTVPLVVRFAELVCGSSSQLVVVTPYFDQINALPHQVVSFRKDIDNQLKHVMAAQMTTNFVLPNLVSFIQP